MYLIKFHKYTDAHFPYKLKNPISKQKASSDFRKRKNNSAPCPHSIFYARTPSLYLGMHKRKSIKKKKQKNK